MTAANREGRPFLPAVACMAVLAGLSWALAHALDGRPLWFDEGYTLLLAGQGWGLLWANAQMDFHPPLYFALAKVWMAVFGGGEVALRLSSFAAAAITLGVLFAMGRRQLPAAAVWVALALLATHWHFLRYAQEARMYALVMLGGTWCALAFARLWNEQALSAGGLSWFCLGALALAMLHYSAMLFSCSALLLLLLRHRRRPAAWLSTGAAGSLCACAVLYHLLHLRGEYLSEVQGFWQRPPVGGFLLIRELGPWRLGSRGLGEWHFGVMFALHLSALLAVAASLRLGARKAGSWRAWLERQRSSEGWATLESLSWLLLAFLLAMAAAGLARDIWVFKSLLVALPLLCVCAGAIAARVLAARAWLLPALVALWGVLALNAAPRKAPTPSVDRGGIEEILRRWEAPGAQARIYCHNCRPREWRGSASWWAAAGGLDGKTHRPVFLRPEDVPHLVPPLFLLSRYRDAAFFGERVEILSPGVSSRQAPGQGRISMYVGAGGAGGA